MPTLSLIPPRARPLPGSSPAAAVPRHTTPLRAVSAIAPASVLVMGMVAAVNLAIAPLQAGHLHPSVSQTAWIVDSYTLVFACLLIPGGALGDRFGRRRGMLTGLGVFALGSALAAIAPSVAVLMAGRALSGLGAALVLPATLATTLGQLAPAQRAQGVALWSALSGVSGVIGNLGGGLAVQAGSWRILFWAGVPLAVAAAGLVAARVPTQEPHRDPIDAAGAAMLTAGMVALLYAIIDGPQAGWGSGVVIGAGVLAAVLLAAFVAFELRIAHPMLDPRLFGLRGVRTGALGILALFFALFGLFYLNAQYLQDVKGYSPLLAGACVLPLAVAMPYASARSTRLGSWIGPRTTIVGGLLMLAAGLFGLSCASAVTPYAAYGALLAVVGVGMGLSMPPLSGLMVGALPASRAGVGSGLNSTTRELGSAIGVAVLGTLLTARFSGHLPLALRALSGTRGDAVRGSITAALAYARTQPDPATRAQLVHATRTAFVTGSSMGLRVGAALVLAVTIVVIHQHPKETP